MGNTNSILVAGAGGQGIQFMGKQLALTGMHLNKKVTNIPSYGAEMRGGTSNCTVMISDEEIGAPVTGNPDIAIAMNLPSFIKFEKTVVPGGSLFCDCSMFDNKSARTDIKIYYIPATAIAYENDMPKSANVIMLGKLIKETGIFTMDELVSSMEKSMAEGKKELLEMNIKALKLGFEY